MSISVTPTLPRTSPSGGEAANAGAAGESAPGLDFASLLFGQLPVTDVAEQLSAALGLGKEKSDGKQKGDKDDLAIWLPEIGQIAASQVPVEQRASLAETSIDADSPPIGDVLGKGAGNSASDTEEMLLAGQAGKRTTQNPLLGADAANSEAGAANLAGEQKSENAFSSILSQTHPSQLRHEASRQVTVQAPLHDAQWGQQLGGKVVWMARGDIQNAQINISPAQLGPIQVNISMNGDQMTANFVASQAEVRQALEEALPRLREMLSGAGIQLGQANVGAQTPQQQRNNDAGFSSSARSGGEDTAILPTDGVAATPLPNQPIQRGRGMVDLFA